MHILYVAKHRGGGNDDEGAITYGLRELGHTVTTIDENRGHQASAHIGGADICLFHKWQDLNTIRKITIPKVFWYFDLVTYDDIKLDVRNGQRVQWMEAVTPLVDLGFCTDGDWVSHDTSGKLHHLTQGADVRTALPGNPLPAGPPIALTGIRTGGGTGRESHVDELVSTYGSSFHHVISGVHGSQLADVIARSRIMIAPDSPTTDLYWSNRVYLTLGYGGFMLHPYCHNLTRHYTDGVHLVYYHTRQDLNEKVEHYLHHPDVCHRIAAAGYAHTLAHHTYTRRCRALVKTAEDHLL